MKIKTISRNEKQFVKQSNSDLQRVFRTVDPQTHQFERAREYTRALNATKLDKIFAKPFIHAMDGHMDAVFALLRHRQRVNIMLSGACDGEARIWNLSNRKCLHSVRAHAGFVRGLTTTPSSDKFLTCSEDKTVKLWHMDVQDGSIDDSVDTSKPVETFLGKAGFNCIDHHFSQNQFVTGSSVIELWDHARTEPLQTYSWGTDTINALKFNSVERHVVLSAASDRSLMLYDVRMHTPIRKVTLAMRTNAVCWNPMEAFNFTAANEDHQLYTFDMRKLTTARMVYKDFLAAVMCLDYSPTGKEFVAGSYDRTIRIFPESVGRSREVFHTKRMQKVFSVAFSGDADYVLSGSDDTNIRLWKSVASRQLGKLLPREKKKVDYNEKLKERFKHVPELKRIARHRHLPKNLKVAQEKEEVMRASRRRKLDNKRKHSKPGTVKIGKERVRNILQEDA
eukprot:GCRY01001715.1.p1 GENE.GCRY01001715.1~~GCRY01001715.1.p1  ORF type:complete len:451 (+),score=37.60 GCRY01001715.1:169-1521(+)